ncbi:MAG TPA: erythromycin esterase family protein [Cytophagaceae bacterium]|nr:erythromycin esterase family protein [Cytophagaceae bacterium]
MTGLTDPWVYTSEDILRDYHRLERSKDLDPLMERIGNAKYVLLGEASHGTHEYYTWRTAISKRLIEEKGFSFIAVEGDWPDCYKLNRLVKAYPGSGIKAEDVVRDFRRWPTWMWANWEIVAFSEWMKNFNVGLSAENKIGFYGLDIYSLWESMEVIVDYLQKEDPVTAEFAMKAVNCFEPYKEEDNYVNALNALKPDCKNEVVRLLQEIRKKAPQYDGDREAGLNAEMNAMVLADAEKYYQAMITFRDNSWNVRDKHMMETLNALMKFHGPRAKVIVWEHNTHIGDARATAMRQEGLLNVGQLVREQHEAEGVVLVGFGSYEGSVIAGSSWGDPMKKMIVPPAKENSVEEILHRDSTENKLLIFDKNTTLKERFNNWLGHRAIGVVYNTERENGNYVPTILPSRYDAFLYINQTKALHPLHIKPDGHLMPETYPFGM